MTLAAIQTAIVTRYTDGNVGLMTFWPGKNYSPDAGVNHAVIWFIPSGNDPASLGSTGTDRISGIVQIDLRYEEGNGIGLALEKADAIAALFQRGQSETSGTTAVVFGGAKILQPRNENGWLRVPISIPWYSHQARSL